MPCKIDQTDIVGAMLGQLRVISFHHSEPYRNPKTGHLYRTDYFYECVCACGRSAVVKRAALVTNHVKSCGCLKPGRRLRAKHPSWRGCGEISLTMWKYTQGLAKKRGIPFELTIEDAWERFEQQKGRCALSGIPLTFVGSTSTVSPDTTASLDRIDNTKGYTSNNIQWLHKAVNRMKWDYDQEDFIRWCRAVSVYKGGSSCG